jgi:hypothetical protein
VKILITRLVEFDEVAERARLLKNFKGGVRDTLVECLDEFVSQRFEDCQTTLVAMPKDWLEFLHPVLLDTMRAMRDRASRAHAYDAGAAARLAANLRTLTDIEGTPLGPDSVEYPKFTFVVAGARAVSA